MDIKDINSSERGICDDHIYLLTISLSEGKSVTMKVFLDSKPEEQAFNFCKENNLDYNAMNDLTKQITDLITKYANTLENKENKESECIQEVDEETVQSLGGVDNVKQKSLMLRNNSTKQHNINNKKCFGNVNTNEDTPVKVVKRKLFSKQKYCRNSNSNNKNNIQYNKASSKIKTIPSNNNNKTKTAFSYEEFLKHFSSNPLYKKQLNIPNSNNATLTLSSYNNNNNNNNHNTSTNNTTLNASSKPTMSIDKRQPNNLKESYNCNCPATPEEKANFIRKLLKKQKPKKIIPHPKSKPFTNNGERLYESSIKSNELKKRKLEKFLTLMKDEEKIKYPFKPSINKNTNKILKKSKSSSYYLTLSSDKKSDILLNYKSFLETKHNKLQLKHKNPNDSFTFEPSLNKRSIEIANRLNYSTDKVLLKSRSDSKFSKIKDEMYKQCSFTPKTNKRTFISLKGSKFNERLKEYKIKSQEKYNKLYISINNPFDEHTGQELFKPSLYSSNSTFDFKVKRHGDVFSHLYNYNKTYQRKLNETKEKFYLTTTMNNKVSNISKESEKIHHKSKYEMFEFLFNKLDIDGNGILSPFNINFEVFPTKVHQVLQPVKTFIKDSNQINKEQFIEIMNDLYGKLSFNERKVLKEYCKPSYYNKFLYDNNNCFTFQPIINKNSKKIMEEKEKTITPLYYYNYN